MKYLNKERTTRFCIVVLSVLGLIGCIAVLFPQVRLWLMDLAEHILHKKIVEYQSWFRMFLSYAIGGICLILFFDYCTLTESGRLLVQKVKDELKDCFLAIDFRLLLKPILFMAGIYLLGILTIIRANFLYIDDIERAVSGVRHWYNYSRYISEFGSIFVHADTNLTDISPIPQLLAVLILSISSVLLVYVLSNKRITVVRLLATLPLGLSPYFLECLSFKFDAPYMALSILASIIPFLFISRKRAFLFCSVVSLLIMCMTYQAASGIYLLVTIMICFHNWNSREKTDKEILSFLGLAAFAFCFAMIVFRFILMRHVDVAFDPSTTMHPLTNIIPGTLNSIKGYATIINQDLGLPWKTGILFVCIFFITKSIHVSRRKKTLSFFISFLTIILSFILSYGVYSLLIIDSFSPRLLYGFGLFLSILCISVVSDYKKIATVTVLALNWCLFVFAFSYGNALADQSRYAEFRIGILFHDISALYPTQQTENLSIQLDNSIEFAPSIKNISKHYPVIERLVHRRLGTNFIWDYMYFWKHFNFQFELVDKTYMDFEPLSLPIVLDSYYHTIKSDGSRMLIILKH